MRCVAAVLLLALLVAPAASAAPPDVEELGESVASCATMVTQPSENPADLALAAAGFAVCVATPQ